MTAESVLNVKRTGAGCVAATALIGIIFAFPGCGGPSDNSVQSTPSESGGGGAAAAADDRSQAAPATGSTATSDSRPSGTAPGDVSAPVVAEKKSVPGLSSPKMHPAEEVELAEDAMVIGVIIGEQARAYVCSAMTSEGSRVVNDLAQKTPVSVTYHDATKGVRVLSGPDADSPLKVGIRSVSDEELTLDIDGNPMAQSSDQIPLQDLDFVLTEWIAWKTEHPDSLVFTGADISDKPSP